MGGEQLIDYNCFWERDWDILGVKNLKDQPCLNSRDVLLCFFNLLVFVFLCIQLTGIL
jgi:hypothetical protein